MAASDRRSSAEVRRDIQEERAQLASALDALRSEFNVTAMLRSKLPVVAAGALGAGFVLAGGIGATMRLLFRRGREGHEVGRVGRFVVLDRD